MGIKYGLKIRSHDQIPACHSKGMSTCFLTVPPPHTAPPTPFLSLIHIDQLPLPLSNPSPTCTLSKEHDWLSKDQYMAL